MILGRTPIFTSQPALVSSKRVVPPAQLFVPPLAQLEVSQVRARVHEHAQRCFGLTQLVIDVDKTFCCSGRGLGKLELLVVQRLGVSVAFLGQGAERARVQRQPLVVVLHKLGQVEQGGDDFGWNGGRGKRGLERAGEGTLGLRVELGPAADKGGGEELSGHRRVDGGEAVAGAKSRARGLAEELDGKGAQPLGPVVAGDARG